jgi:hypothetical protein
MSPAVVRANPRGFRFAIDIEYFGALAAVTSITDVSLENTAAGGGTQADSYYNGWAWIYMKNGNAAGDIRRIVGYTGATDRAVVDRPFRALPTAADLYSIVTVLTGEPIIMLAAAGAADSVTLPAAGGIRDDFWANCPVDLLGGKGGNGIRPANQRSARNYVGSTKVLTVDKPWDTHEGGVPDGTTIIRIWPHLYHPMSSFDALELGGGNLIYSPQIGGIGNGVGLKSAEIDHAQIPTIDSYLEVVGEAAGTLLISRWE